MARKTAASAIGVQSKPRPGLQQMDLFGSSRAVIAPDWSALPEDARETLVGLMTRLILDHARTAEASHDH